MPRALRWGLLLGTAVFSALACYRIELSSRQSYLLLLQEALRSQAAERMAQPAQSGGADRCAHRPGQPPGL